MSTKPFFRFSLDETNLHGFFSTVEERLAQYDALFQQQNEKISTLNNQMKQQTEKNQISAKIQVDLKSMNSKICTIEDKVQQNQDLIEKLSSKVTELESSFEAKLAKVVQNFDNKLFAMKTENDISTKEQIDSQINDIEKHTNELIIKSIDPIQSQINHFNENLINFKNEAKNGSDKFRELESEMKESRSNLELINKYFLSLNTSTVTKNTKSSLSESLAITSSHVISQFSSLFDSVTTIRSDILTIEDQLNRPKEPPVVKTPEPDLEHLQLRSDIVNSDINKPPLLPKLHKFHKVAQCVDYIYELVPILQNSLNNLFDISNFNRSEKERTISEMRYDIADIRSIITNMATRDDLNILMRRKVFTPSDNDSNRNVGSVRCIACGRELQGSSSQQFPGEQEINCINNNNSNNNNNKAVNNRIGTAINNASRRFNVGIIENPRSARAYHTPQICKKIQSPK